MKQPFKAIYESGEKIRNTIGPRLQNNALLFFIISSSQMVDNINVTGFMTCVEDLQEQFGIDYPLASWTLSSYALAYAGFILLFGRVSDIIGHHIMLTIGLIALGICSIVAAAVKNIYVLIVFRAFQGVCAAATVPPSFAIIAHTFSGRLLTIALSALTALLIAGLGIGFVIGGAFTLTSIGYRSLCWFTAAYALVFGIMAALALKPCNSNAKSSLKNLDYVGVFLLVAGGILVVTGFTEAGESWKRPRAYVLIIVGVLLMVVFGCWEILYFKNGRSEGIEMLIPKVMWTIKNFKVLPVVTFFMYAGFISLLTLTVQYFNYIFGDSPLIAGVRLLPIVVTMTIVTTTLSIIPFGRISPKMICSVACLISTAGLILINRADPTKSYTYWRYFFPGIILFAGGSNGYFVNYLNIITLATPLNMQGLISGICLAMGQYGVSVGLAVVTSIISDSNTAGLTVEELGKSYQRAFYFPVASLSACTLLCFFFVRDLKLEDHKQSEKLEQELQEDKDEEFQEDQFDGDSTESEKADAQFPEEKSIDGTPTSV